MPIAVSFINNFDLFVLSFFLVLDILFLLSLRLGYESTRLYMNDSIRVFFACFQSTHEPIDENNRSRATSILTTSTNRDNSSPVSSYGQNPHGNSTDGDEYCRITIDSLTKSYKIGSPVKPQGFNGRQSRSISHSLLTPTYTDGKKKKI